MRQIGSLHPTESVPVQADTQQIILLAANTPQAMDWAVGSSNIGKIVRLTGLSSAGAQFNFLVNLQSTFANIPTTGTSTLGSTYGTPVLGQGLFQVGGGSTGWSAAAQSSGYVIAEIWKQ